uniref:cGMP-dependent protein kinase n=1 Tax=Takifugu rubripes TaxID=31033 RepID=H2U538_TAKRU
MCLLYISITCLTLKKSFTEKRLQEKEKLLQNLQSQYHDLGECPALTSCCSWHFQEFSLNMLFLSFRFPFSANLIVKAIQKNDFLSRLDDEQTAMMVELLAVSSFKPGDHASLCLGGELRVTQAGRDLRTLTTGDVFGELAILYNCKRTATVTAKTAVRLWCMERQTYRTIITNKSKKRREQLMGFLKMSRTLKDLNDVQLSKIIDSMEEVKYQDKDVIVREGAEANTFYIILKGEVLVTKNVNGHQKQIRRMGKGEHFGEQALIREVLRTATCSADGPVTCLSIDKEFKDLVPVLYQEGRYQGDPVTLGVGGFGRVELVGGLLNHGMYYAMKRVSKKHIVAKRQEEHMLFEKKVLKAIQCDFIVRLHATFKDTCYVYMIMEFYMKCGRFDEPTAVFCTACVVEAFAYLHKKSVMYRDLKPENLMLDVKGYVKLVDFGFAKEMVRGEKTYSFVGTPEYMAPEIIKNQGHDFAVDFWSLGILIFELLAGSPPFSSSEPQKIYAKILDGVLKYPPYLSEASKSIISKLCRPRPGQRLGNTKNGIKDVRHHRWFSSINWHKLRMSQLDAPTGPCYINFDRFPVDHTKAEEDFSGWDREF